MAHVQKRTRNGKSTYRARWVDPDGGERCRTFRRKIDADRWLDQKRGEIARGLSLDEEGGRRPFGEYATVWLDGQVWKESTDALVRTHFANHVLPHFAARPISSIRSTEIQSWVKGRSEVLAPGTVRVVFRYTASVFKAAVRDRLIASSPCDGTKLPTQERPRVEPLAVAEVEALTEAVPGRYRALVVLAAGTGMRQGECLGLTADRVDFLRRRVTVDRQLVAVKGAPKFSTPKTKASVRAIPLPDVVLEALSTHMAEHPLGEDGLIFTNEAGRAVRRNKFSAKVWRPATVTVGVAGARFHDLRHFYASLLIRHGESVKVVQSRLGHASASETLDCYSHLWPDSDDCTREAIDSVLGAADGPQTDQRRTTGG